MNPNTKTTIWATLLTLALYFSGFLVFITPLPLIYLLLKRTDTSPFKLVFPAIAIVLLIYNFGTEPLYAFYKSNPSIVWLFPVPMTEMLEYFSPLAVKSMGATYFLVFVAIGVGLSKAMKTEKELFKHLLWLVVSLFVVVGIITTLLVYPHSEMLLADFRNYMGAGLQKFIEVQEKSGMDLEQIIYLKSKIAEYVQYSFFMLPFVYFMTLSFLVVLNLVISKRFFVMHFPFIEKLDLTRFKVPFGFVWLVIVMFVLLLLNEKYLHNDPLYYTLLNLGLSFGIIYFLQGFAVAIHFMNSRQIFGLLRLAFYFMLLMMMQSSIFILASIGFFENWMDVRKLDSKTKKAPFA